MKAIVFTRYGPPEVLQLREAPTPSPTEDEVLVRVHAASLNAADFETMRGHWSARFGGPLRPQFRIPGSDVAGRVERIGGNIKRFQPGDEVWGDLSFPHGFGAFAEYVAVSEEALAPKPASMTFEEAAAYPQAAIIALQTLRDKAEIQPGQKVLINGAGGGMGTFAVQIAKMYGAEVTGVDSAAKFDMLRSLGTDHVIDYRQTDYTRTGQQYDVILDMVAHLSPSDYERTLSSEGRFIIVGGSLGTFLQVVFRGALASKSGGKTLGINAYDANNREDLAHLGELFEAGQVVPIIDRHFPLREVPEALRYLEGGRALGKVVITVVDEHGP